MIKPGARIIKTTIAVFLSMVVSYFFTRTPSTIAPISAVIVLKKILKFLLSKVLQDLLVQ